MNNRKKAASSVTALAVISAMVALPAIGQHAEHDRPPATAAQASPADATPPGEGREGHQMSSPTAERLPRAPVSSSNSTAQDHANHEMPIESTAADLQVGSEPAPPAAALGLADIVYGSAAMVRARNLLSEEHGGTVIWKIMLDQAEYQAGPDGAGYGWDAEAWFGGDLHRLVLKTEGQGTARRGVEDAEWQALYSRAVGPYTDLQFGIRQDIGNSVASYATVGVEALLPYWFKAEGALFLSHRGDVLARLQGTYDLLLTQQIVLQPNLELNFAVQNVPKAELSGGLTDITAGLRIRYDITRNFSPYIGLEFERSIGGTASLRAALGDRVENVRFVAGVRAFL